MFRSLVITLTAQRFLRERGSNPYETARVWRVAAECHDDILWQGDVR